MYIKKGILLFISLLLYGKYWTITPKLNYSFALESESEDLMEVASYDGDDSDFFWGGVTLSLSF